MSFVRKINFLIMNTVHKGDVFEDLVYKKFHDEIFLDDGSFPHRAKSCKIFKKKGYFSKDRETDIVFDISIEIYLPNSDKYTMVYLIECKNYSGNVPVDDIEEFHSKTQQVASSNCKAIIVSNAAIASGGIKFAASKGIGYIRFFTENDFKWELPRPASSTYLSDLANNTNTHSDAFSSFNYKPKFYDLYLLTPTFTTNSFRNFFDYFSNDFFQKNQKIKKRNRNTALKYLLSKNKIEKIVLNLHQKNCYTASPILLENYLDNELKIITVNDALMANIKLGDISFEKSEITVYLNNEKPTNIGRLRFTIAHELGHYYLKHNRYFSKEYFEESDLDSMGQSVGNNSIFQALEFQANYFAGCLLMPEDEFINDLYKLIHHLKIKIRGRGLLYVDNQPCNIETFKLITEALTKKYQVSTQAATIRLKQLKLLIDEREFNKFQQSIFSINSFL